jgi:predicted nucleotidyltransferase
MTSTIQKMMDKGLLQQAPPFLRTNVHYETIMGSHAYGVADTSVRDKVPDFDVYGFAIPPKESIFPHLVGHIQGFGTPPPRFEQFQRHHIFDPDALGGIGKEWDFNIFSIVKFFELCRENNPNMIDSVFTPEECVIHCTQVGQLVRDNRRLFLSKKCWKKFRGYASAQIKKERKGLESKEMNRIVQFENDHKIPRETSLKDVESEMKKRGLLTT